MVFSSNIFLFWFLPLALLFYYLMPTIKAKNVVLLFLSFFFYFWGEDELVLLMLLSCVMNYILGLGISSSKKPLGVLWLGLIFNLSLLGYYKYADFFIQNTNRLLPSDNQLGLLNIALPIGISFFTFQSISYLVDVYRNEVEVQKNPFKLSLYISLFPQLVAGPIVRYHDIAKSLNERTHSLELFKSGINRFIIGLSKKLLIANTMAQVADEIMIHNPNELTSYIAWAGALAYTLQIYYDFSGYSDMAIGLGRMFGFKFLENFNFPYAATSIQDFWRRWHISLSTWFRDYLYIPLGGNRISTERTYANLIIVFFLTGMWHGASWGFVIWGLFHGAFLIFEKLGLKSIIGKFKFISHAYTLLVVIVAWVFFRIENIDMAIHYLKVMFTGSNGPAISFEFNSEQLFIMLIGFFFAFNGVQLFKLIDINFLRLSSQPRLLDLFKSIGMLLLFFLCILALSSNSYNPFIYYRF